MSESVKTPGLVGLGGRLFRVIDFDRRSTRQDHYLRRELALSGMDKIMPGEGEANEEWLLRLHAALIHSGRAPEMIAGYLLPQGVLEAQWTPALAAETAAFVGALDTAKDRERVDTLAMECAFGFFRQAAERLQRFHSFLAARSPEGSAAAARLTH